MVNTWVGEQRWYSIAPKRVTQRHKSYCTVNFGLVRDVKGDSVFMLAIPTSSASRQPYERKQLY